MRCSDRFEAMFKPNYSGKLDEASITSSTYMYLQSHLSHDMRIVLPGCTPNGLKAPVLKDTKRKSIVYMVCDKVGSEDNLES